MKPDLFSEFFTAIIVFVSDKSSAQSFLLSPGINNEGIYSKAAAAVNPFLPLPSYTVPDSGASTPYVDSGN